MRYTNNRCKKLQSSPSIPNKAPIHNIVVNQHRRNRNTPKRRKNHTDLAKQKVPSTTSYLIIYIKTKTKTKTKNKIIYNNTSSQQVSRGGNISL